MSSLNWPAFGVTLLPNIGGWMGAAFTHRAIDNWYEKLNKPDWRPPNSAFGPVWTALYSSMGYASYIVWKEGGGFSGPARMPLALYGTQLALNWSWSPIFFGAKSIKGGLINIIILDGAVLATALAFFKINKTAGYLFLPYIAWLGLATALNYVVYRDNPQSVDKSIDAAAPKK